MYVGANASARCACPTALDREQCHGVISDTHTHSCAHAQTYTHAHAYKQTHAHTHIPGMTRAWYCSSNPCRSLFFKAGIARSSKACCLCVYGGGLGGCKCVRLLACARAPRGCVCCSRPESRDHRRPVACVWVCVCTCGCVCARARVYVCV